MNEPKPNIKTREENKPKEKKNCKRQLKLNQKAKEEEQEKRNLKTENS